MPHGKFRHFNLLDNTSLLRSETEKGSLHMPLHWTPLRSVRNPAINKNHTTFISEFIVTLKRGFDRSSTNVGLHINRCNPIFRLNDFSANILLKILILCAKPTRSPQNTAKSAILKYPHETIHVIVVFTTLIC